MSGMVDRISALVTIIVEVEAGLRPQRHLRPFLHPALQHQLPALLRPGGPTRHIHRVTVQRDRDHVEAVALLRERDDRMQALAIAMDRADGRWLVTAMDRPGERRARSGHDGGPVLTMRRWSTIPPDQVTLPPVKVPAGWLRAA